LASRLRKLLPFLYQNALKIFPDVPPRTGNGQKLHTSHTLDARMQLLHSAPKRSRVNSLLSDRPMIFFNLPPARRCKCACEKNGAARLIICLSGREMRWMFTLPPRAQVKHTLSKSHAETRALSVFIETGHTQMRRRTFLPPPYWDIIDFLFTSNAKKSSTR
jgi:hypothetical protein